MIQDGFIYMMVVAIPAIAFVEFLCRLDDREKKKKKESRERIKREIRDHHSS